MTNYYSGNLFESVTEASLPIQNSPVVPNEDAWCPLHTSACCWWFLVGIPSGVHCLLPTAQWCLIGVPAAQLCPVPAWCQLHDVPGMEGVLGEAYEGSAFSHESYLFLARHSCVLFCINTAHEHMRDILKHLYGKALMWKKLHRQNEHNHTLLGQTC